MKALTIWQPYASLVALGAKPYEFRGWTPPKSFWGKRIAIHSAVRTIRQDEVAQLIYRLERGEAVPGALKASIALPFLEQVRLGKELPLGCVLGTALMGYPTTTSSVLGEGATEIQEFGQFAWPLSKFEALPEPVPAKGAQGFWDWHPEEVAA